MNYMSVHLNGKVTSEKKVPGVRRMNSRPPLDSYPQSEKQRRLSGQRIEIMSPFEPFSICMKFLGATLRKVTPSLIHV